MFGRTSSPAWPVSCNKPWLRSMNMAINLGYINTKQSKGPWYWFRVKKCIFLLQSYTGGGAKTGLSICLMVYFGPNPCLQIWLQSNLISFQWFCFTENYAFCIELSPLQVAIMGLELCQRNLPKSISTEHPAPPFCTADPTRTKYRISSHNHNLFFWQHPSYIFISPRRGLDRQIVWLNLMWHPRLLSS